MSDTNFDFFSIINSLIKTDDLKEITKVTEVLSTIYNTQQDKIKQLETRLFETKQTLQQIKTLATNTARIDYNKLCDEIAYIAELELENKSK